MDEYYITFALENEFTEIQNNRRVKNKVLDSNYYREEVKKSLDNISEHVDKEKKDNCVSQFFTLDMIKEKLIADLEVYEIIYKNINIAITNEEWDIIFDNLYEYYGKENNLECYYDSVRLNRLAISEAILDNKELSFSNYIKNIRLLNFVSKREKRFLRNKMLEDEKKIKVISLDEYRMKKQKKLCKIKDSSLT